MSTGESITVMVKYARAKGNALPFKFSASETVFDLAKAIKSNADDFGLEGKDIKINTVDIFTRSEDGSKLCLNFGNELGAVKAKNSEVEFDNNPSEYIELPVKYIHSVNPIKLRIESSKDVIDLVKIILENIENFRLSEEIMEKIKTPGNEIRLLRSTGNEEYQPISHQTRVAQMATEIIEFELVTSDMKDRGKPIELSVTSTESSETVLLECRENDMVHNMVALIKEKIDKFKLSSESKDALADRSKQIILSPVPSKKGAYVGVFDAFQKLGELKEKNIQLRIVDRKKPPSIEELAELCVDQKIAFFGAVGHGKSSTINTVARAFPGVQDSIAETSGGEAAGTHVVSPHTFTIGNKTFHFIDVPGGALPMGETTANKEKLRKIISWIVDGKFPEDLPTNYWDESNTVEGLFKYITGKNMGKVDAVVIVHRGYAPEVEVITRIASDVAMARGRGIPVFGIITNIDKLKDDAEIQDKIEYLSLAANIDEGSIYPLSNIQEGPTSSQLGGRDRDEYVLCMLRSILSRSKRYKLKQHVKLK
ncbi:uncharacterized protein [Ptychodera flava]|uniref:uncharacterized protein n=1 Tax=Ptychodera flava TaxID=63121 RepID=UPI003969DAD1